MINQYTEEFLRLLRKTNREIAQKMDKLEELKAGIEGCSAIGYDEKVQSSGEMDRMASTVAKIVDLEHEIEELSKSYDNGRAWFQYILNKIESETQKKVLASIYIDGNSVMDTAILLTMTESGVKKAKARALKTIFAKVQEESCQN